MPRKLTQFKKGKSGNPHGRPKGSRNKLSAKFLEDIEKHWEKHGNDVLERVCQSHPEMYLKTIANLISKEEPVDQPVADESLENKRMEFFKKLSLLTGQAQSS